MSETITMQGSALTAGPNLCSDGSVFPSGATSIQLDLNPAQKGYQVGTGRQLLNVNTQSPQALSGIGAGQTVTQATTLYMRSVSPFTVQVTYTGVSGTQPIPLNGLLVLEANPSNPITAVTVVGSGQLEYGAWGNQ